MRINHQYYFLILVLMTFNLNGFAQGDREIDSITKLIHKAEKAGNDTLVAKQLSALAGCHMVNNNPELSLKVSQKQLAISQKIGYKFGIATAYDLQGAIYDYKGDYDKALNYCFKSLSLFLELNNKVRIANLKNSIGIIYAKKGIYSEALKYYLQALKIASEENDNFGLISTYNNIGLTYENQKKYDEALNYYLKCLHVQQKLGKGYYIQATLLNIGNLYRTMNQPEIAMNYYRRGVENSIGENDNPSLASNYSGIGDVYVSREQWDKALENNYKALEIRKRMDDGYGLINSNIALGEIYHKTGNNQKALDHTLQALQLVKKRGGLEFQVQIHEQLSNIYESMGNKDLSLKNYKLFKTFNDSIFNAENEKKLTEQHMNFDFKLKEEKTAAKTKQELRYQKNLRNYTIAGLFVLAIFVIIVLRQRYKLKSIRKQKAHDAAMHKLENEMAIKEMEAQALKVENENSLLKEEKLQEKLDFNQRELASATMYLYQKNEMLTDLQNELEDASSSIPEKSVAKMKNAIQNNMYVDADWEKFRIHFENVHADFFKNLLEKHPNLTSYEVRLAAYFHIQLSTKEIAALLNISPLSVYKAKSRLNKKLNDDKG